MPHYFHKGQLKKLFFLFPDPHFKAKNHRRRIVTTALLAEYAYFLTDDGTGLLYSITDVLELHQWMVLHCERHPLFRRLTDAELANDPCVPCVRGETEEGKKVARLGGNKYLAVFRRLAASELPATGFWESPDVEVPAPPIRMARPPHSAPGAAAPAADAAGAAASVPVAPAVSSSVDAL